MPDTWAAIAEVVVETRALPIVDFAYQGFGFGLREDADWLAGLARPGLEFLVCTSYSKNFALYNERVGALTVVAADAERAASRPEPRQDRHPLQLLQPAGPRRRHRGRRSWATRICGLAGRWTWPRCATASSATGSSWWRRCRRPASRATGNRSASSAACSPCSGCPAEQVARLRDEFAVYVVGKGRINVAGLTPANLATVVAGGQGRHRGLAAVAPPLHPLHRTPDREPPRRRAASESPSKSLAREGEDELVARSARCRARSLRRRALRLSFSSLACVTGSRRPGHAHSSHARAHRYRTGAHVRVLPAGVADAGPGAAVHVRLAAGGHDRRRPVHRRAWSPSRPSTPARCGSGPRLADQRQKGIDTIVAEARRLGLLGSTTDFAENTCARLRARPHRRSSSTARSTT